MTLTTGSRVLVIVTAQISPSAGSGNGGSVSFSVNGGAANADQAVTFVSAAEGGRDHGRWGGNGAIEQASTMTYLSVTPGSNTFTLEYEQIGWGATSFSNRSITVIPLG